MDKKFTTTNIIVIRKNLFKESSFLVTGFSPALGKIDIIVKGARSLKSKKLPVIDLFRVLEIEVNKNLHKLQAVYNASLINSYDEIANCYQNFTKACNICNFIYFNIHPEVSCPLTYQAIVNVFEILAENKKFSLPLDTLVILMFLYENGFLPEIPDDNTGRKKLFDNIILALLKKYEFPDLPQDYWRELANWINSICSFHNIRTM